jgi:hypothetical protein
MGEQGKLDVGAVYNRRFPRRQLTTVVGVLSQGIYNIVPCIEIGEGGLQFQASEKHIKGALVVANLFLPKEHFMAVTAEIVYVVPLDKGGRSSYGLKFRNLTFEARRQIRDYIAEKPATEASQQA